VIFVIDSKSVKKLFHSPHAFPPAVCIAPTPNAPMFVRALYLLPFLALTGLRADTRITSNGVTWILTESRQTGVFVNGDRWVISPVTVVSIAGSLNSPDFTTRTGQNGSMLNPDTNQGYANGINNDVSSPNAALPEGRPLSPGNPLAIPAGSPRASAVSWLYRSEADQEPGCPRFDGATKSPRLAPRSACTLTVLAKAPPSVAFRPPYVGSDKSIHFRAFDLDYSKRPLLASPAGVPPPSFSTLAEVFSKTRLDHVNGWPVGHLHAFEHMPNSGRDMVRLVGEATRRPHRICRRQQPALALPRRNVERPPSRPSLSPRYPSSL
jgi:hypothetical protein